MSDKELREQVSTAMYDTDYKHVTEESDYFDKAAVDAVVELIQAHTNAEIASTLVRLCTQIIKDYEPMIDSRGHTRKVVPVTKLELAIEAERNKLKEEV